MARNKTSRNISSVGDLLNKSLPASALMVLKLNEIKKAWVAIVDPKVSSSTSPVSFDKTGLVVVCSDSNAAQLIKLSSGGILRRIKARWDIDFPAIRTVVGKVERPSSTSNKDVHEITADPQTVEECYKEISQKVQDKETAMSLARLQALYKKRFSKKTKDGD